MAITFDITNITPNLQDMTMVVFYSFSNGENFTNKVPADTPVTEILQWGQDKCVWFDEREVELESMKQELIDNPIIEE